MQRQRSVSNARAAVDLWLSLLLCWRSFIQCSPYMFPFVMLWPLHAGMRALLPVFLSFGNLACDLCCTLKDTAGSDFEDQRGLGNRTMGLGTKSLHRQDGAYLNF